MNVTCPRCGGHTMSSAVSHPCGGWLCDCGTLHDGASTNAWQRWASRRTAFQEYVTDPRWGP